MKSELAKPKEMFSNWKRGRKNDGIENSKEREDTFSLWTLPEVGDNDFAFVISDFRLFSFCVLHPLHLHLSTSLVLFLPFYSLCRPLWHVLHPLYLVFIFSYTIGMMSVHICCCYQPNVLACATQPNGLTIQWMRFYRALHFLASLLGEKVNGFVFFHSMFYLRFFLSNGGPSFFVAILFYCIFLHRKNIRQFLVFFSSFYEHNSFNVRPPSQQRQNQVFVCYCRGNYSMILRFVHTAMMLDC